MSSHSKALQTADELGTSRSTPNVKCSPKQSVGRACAAPLTREALAPAHMTARSRLKASPASARRTTLDLHLCGLIPSVP
jgi:hypothetical protein